VTVDDQGDHGFSSLSRGKMCLGAAHVFP
jgi:hypothetical protein